MACAAQFTRCLDGSSEPHVEPHLPWTCITEVAAVHHHLRFLDGELKAGRRMVLLDTRVTSRWQQGHIEGAVPLPYNSDPKQVLAGLPRDGTWLVAYCECPRAAAESVVKRLRKNGLDHTGVLREGFQGWASLGHPVVAGDTPVAAATSPAKNTHTSAALQAQSRHL